jgi:phosphate/sulfate permease
MEKGSGNNKKIINQINKLALILLASSISFFIGKNAYYNAIDIMRVVVYASIRKLSIEGSSEELLTLSKGKYCSPDVVQRRIH